MFYFVGFYLNKHVSYKVNGIIFLLHCFYHKDKRYLGRPDFLAFHLGYQVSGTCVVSREHRCWNCKQDTKCLRCAGCKVRNKIGKHTLFCAGKLKRQFQIISDLRMKTTLMMKGYAVTSETMLTSLMGSKVGAAARAAAAG